MDRILDILTKELGKKREHIKNVIDLLDDGNTIPFIARYRKEMHGAMDDTALRSLETRLAYLRQLKERKEEVIRKIGEQGKLTDKLRAQIEEAEVMQRVEDLYKPFKQKRATRASKAKEQGLEPLAVKILLQKPTHESLDEIATPYINPEKEIGTAQEALQGACDIIAEHISDSASLLEVIRKKTYARGRIATEAVDDKEHTVYDMYYGRDEAISRIPNHRILAINRGEKEKKLKVKVEADSDQMIDFIRTCTLRGQNIYTPLLEETVTDAYRRLIEPSIERDMRKLLTGRAQADAVKVFAKNTENLLMEPPVNDARVIAIDPGYRTGCKVAVLDETGKLLDHTTIYPTAPRCDKSGAKKTLRKLAEKYHCNVIVIGNGTASRETEEVVSDFIRESGLDLQYTIVNEAGASVYSASALAAKEYPDLDVTVRGAMSLGRRLQDPLAELVKIDPKHIGVGQYQHDIDQKALTEALTGVVENCVNRVGVDLNTASPSLLSYVSGINASIADNIVSFREENGRFTNRKELLQVPRLGRKAYEQCAGFLRISGGSQPLDGTAVHPESYGAARKLMEKLHISGEDISRGGVTDLDERVRAAYPDGSDRKMPGSDGSDRKISGSDGIISTMAKDLDVGEMTLKDILEELKKPGRDPREDAPAIIFRQDVRSFDDLKEGMELTGTVRNVVDFGAFVDIGVKQDGLVHISKMSHKYVAHPMDVVSIGDTVKVTILSVDKEKKRISLSMVD